MHSSCVNTSPSTIRAKQNMITLGLLNRSNTNRISGRVNKVYNAVLLDRFNVISALNAHLVTGHDQ